MEVYKYTLDKGSKKFLCPNCTKKTFVLYMERRIMIEYGGKGLKQLLLGMCILLLGLGMESYCFWKLVNSTPIRFTFYKNIG